MAEMLTEAGFKGRGETEADAYMRIVTARYMLLRTHDWSPEVVERLRREDRGRGRRTRMPPRRRRRPPTG